jgi:hypothetical protein
VFVLFLENIWSAVEKQESLKKVSLDESLQLKALRIV